MPSFGRTNVVHTDEHRQLHPDGLTGESAPILTIGSVSESPYAALSSLS